MSGQTSRATPRCRRANGIDVPDPAAQPYHRQSQNTQAGLPMIHQAIATFMIHQNGIRGDAASARAGAEERVEYQRGFASGLAIGGQNLTNTDRLA